MNPAAGGLSVEQAARLREAFGLLQRGRAREGAALAKSVADGAPTCVDALHLLALCLKACGDDAAAASAFQAARLHAPRDANVLGNYANLLTRMKRREEAVALYRGALAISPGHAEHWTNLGLALIDSGDAAAACAALERAAALRPNHSTTWQALGSARRARGDLEGAETALRNAVKLDASNGAAWVSLGVVRRLLGDPTDSLGCYTAARRAGFRGPEIEDAEASAWLDLGDTARALEGARRVIGGAPTYVAGYTMLAKILWEHGRRLAPDEDPAAAFRAAVASQPAHRALRLAYVRFLLDAHLAEEALAHVHTLRAEEDGPAPAAMEARALEILDRHADAAAVLAAAWPLGRQDAGFLSLYARHLLRMRDPQRAAECAQAALGCDPAHQSALAYLSVAWRMLGDEREHWLCGYDDLVRELRVEPPSGFADEDEFIGALKTALSPLHTAVREPVDQSLRTGSQSSGFLFGRREPAIVAMRDAVARCVQKYIAQLEADERHPFLRRRTQHVRFAGSWSVRLTSGGNHVNHFHQEGWISSACYVSLPPSVEHSREGHAGWIQFGEPPQELALELAPRRLIRPQIGALILFPSYLWHGTRPFSDREARLTVAFDVAPNV